MHFIIQNGNYIHYIYISHYIHYTYLGMSALSSSFFQLFEFSCFAICVLYDIFSIMVNYGFTVAKLLHLHYNDFLTCNQTHLAYCCALSVMCNRDLRLRGSSGHSLMLSPLGAPCMQGPVVPSQRLLSLW